MNEFQFLQWFLAEQFGEQLKSIVAKGGDIVSNLSKLNERINLMEENLKAKFDKLASDQAVANELNGKILNEVKDTVKKLADANSGSADAIKAAVDAAKAAQAAEDKVAFDAAMAEISAAADGLQASQDGILASAKLIDDQIADLPVTPAPAI